ncbi:HNH endonuclease [Phyllobacterium leguminum]|uniref:HNH endonuclease n=1 Tax=Phyllobacterium leguminum TaxID=314237 RepID=A0A318T5U3_9HYPH|nr:HNH endonuclease [Phyllobacterium leguminum]PYE89607.1 HNH endonuclease [Phyllobacterium leguminum]
MQNSISFDRLHKLLEYVPAEGHFVWKSRSISEFASEMQWKRWRTRYEGKKAGSVNGSGYRHIQLDRRHYLEHRLAWLYYYGEFPANEIDHINGDKADNRLANLRHVTAVQNNQNKKRPSHNTSGVIGVAPARSRGKWIAHIKVGEENIYLGTFKSIELAAAARRGAEKVAGFHPNHGRRTA